MLTSSQATIAHIARAIAEERLLQPLDEDECAAITDSLLHVVMTLSSALNRKLVTTDAPLSLTDSEASEVGEHDRAIGSILGRALDRQGLEGGNA